MKISSNEAGFYPSIIEDYLNGKLKNEGIVDWDYNMDTLKQNVLNRSFDDNIRKDLVDVLTQQYKSINNKSEVLKNIELLSKPNTYTITTGHQLSLFGGPMFFITKILEVIVLVDKMKDFDPDNNFVPVFWMASEDHDFEEISSINLFNQKLTWENKSKGSVGRFDLLGIDLLIEEIKSILGDGEHSLKIIEVLNNSYLRSSNLAEATMLFAHEIFGSRGLLVLNPDNFILKKHFVDVAKKELEDKVVSSCLANRENELSNYKLIVSPREINLFYILDNYRERIVELNNQFETADGKYKWTKEKLFLEIDNYPEKISPNVTLRPVFQELILPNICYVGGAGEISYWLQLTSLFKALKVSYPLPLVRKSFLFLRTKQLDKIEEWKLSLSDFFMRKDLLENKFIELNFKGEIDISSEKKEFEKVFNNLMIKGKSIDIDLEKVVLGEQKRALSVLDNLEKRFRAAEKRQHNGVLSQLETIYSKIFPNGSFQERNDSAFQYLTNTSLNQFLTVLEEKFEFFKNEIQVVKIEELK